MRASFIGLEPRGTKIAAGLVDEFQLFINPAVLGAGRCNFDQGGFRNLRLHGSKAYDCGMVVNRYAPAR